MDGDIVRSRRMGLQATFQPDSSTAARDRLYDLRRVQASWTSDGSPLDAAGDRRDSPRPRQAQPLDAAL